MVRLLRLAEQCIFLAWSFATLRAGMIILSSKAMIAITTSNSISVKPGMDFRCRVQFDLCFILIILFKESISLRMVKSRGQCRNSRSKRYITAIRDTPAILQDSILRVKKKPFHIRFPLKSPRYTFFCFRHETAVLFDI